MQQAIIHGEWATRALSGRSFCDIGQLSAADKRELAKLVKAGQLTTWKDYWFWHGLGKKRTWWGRP